MSPDSEVMQNAIEVFEAKAAVATAPSELDQLLAFLPATPRDTPIRAYLVFHEGDLSSSLARAAARLPDLSVTNLEAGAFELQRTYGRKRERTTRGVFSVFPTSFDNIYRIVTVSDSAFWRNAVLRFVRRRYPRLVPAFFSQTELRKALRSVETNLGPRYQLTIKDVLSRKPRSDADVPGVSAKYATKREWTETSVDAVFDEALERGEWVRSIAFRIEDGRLRRPRARSVALCRLYWDGQAYFSWLYQEFAQSLFPVLERATHDRMTLYTHRGIRERNYQPAKPLQVEYGVDVFDDKDILGEFTTVFMAYPQATKALFHSNPYFHATVADFLDGSSFDVWILSPRRILLIPQAKGSAAALGRLTSYIFSEFREGQVGEYSG